MVWHRTRGIRASSVGELGPFQALVVGLVLVLRLAWAVVGVVVAPSSRASPEDAVDRHQKVAVVVVVVERQIHPC